MGQIISNVFKGSLAVLFSVILALGIGEAALRFAYPDGFSVGKIFEPWNFLQFDSVLGWRNIAKFDEGSFKINSTHHRGREVSPLVEEGGVRVMCVGDSRTFGVWAKERGIFYDNDYPRILERLIAESTPSGEKPAEVINAGVIGYTAAHGLRQLVTEGLDFSPSVVVVAFGFNDLLKSWHPARRAHEPESAAARQLLYAFHDFRILQLVLNIYQNSKIGQPAPFTVLNNEPQDYRRHLVRIVEAARSRNIQVLFLNQAIREESLGYSQSAKESSIVTAGGYETLAELHQMHRKYQGILFEVAKEMNVPVADAAKTFEQWEGEPLFGMGDLVHVNPLGATVIAEVLHEKLYELGWLRHAQNAMQ